MTIPDDILMAYADGEADAATRARVETALREDPEIARRISQHRALRETMQGALAEVLEEPVPERLIAAARGQAAPLSGNAMNAVVDLADVRAAANRKARAATPRRWQPVALAASLLLGVGVGYLAWHGSGTLIEANSGGLVAGSALAHALSTQLSEDRGTDRVVVTGLSFRDKTGGFCRTFSLSDAGASGLACREGAHWNIKTLAQSAHPENDTNFRPAGSAMPAAIRAAVEELIDGEPMDRNAEIAARQAGWTAPPH